jgi:hypothetical protein
MASIPTFSPFDFLFFEVSTMNFTTDTAFFEVDVTVTNVEPFLAEYKSTVLRSFPLTRIDTFP